jgi:hypothetical protein
MMYVQGAVSNVAVRGACEVELTGQARGRLSRHVDDVEELTVGVHLHKIKQLKKLNGAKICYCCKCVISGANIFLWLYFQINSNGVEKLVIVCCFIGSCHETRYNKVNSVHFPSAVERNPELLLKMI